MKLNMTAKWPAIAKVAADIEQHWETIKDDPLCWDDGSAPVRLQVYEDGDWAVRTGDASYDQDHHGFWGAGLIGRRENKFDDIARDLLEQAKESYEMARLAED